MIEGWYSNLRHETIRNLRCKENEFRKQNVKCFWNMGLLKIIVQIPDLRNDEILFTCKNFNRVSASSLPSSSSLHDSAQIPSYFTCTYACNFRNVISRKCKLWVSNIFLNYLFFPSLSKWLAPSFYNLVSFYVYVYYFIIPISSVFVNSVLFRNPSFLSI